MLYGREREQRELGRLLTDAASGRGGAVVVLAEPGGGKSALLRWVGSSQEFQVLSCTGVESEAELPFAALQSVLSGAMGHLPGIPGPQAEALAFAARRLAAEKVFLLFAAREGAVLPGVPELALKRLDPVAARALLTEHAPGLPAHVHDRVLAEADSNPLALLELPKAAADDSGHLPLPHRLQDAYRRRIAKLPAPARTALLVAAAEESGALAVTLRAMSGLGLTAGALAAAEGERLITVEAQKIRSTTRRRGRSRPASGPAGR